METSTQSASIEIRMRLRILNAARRRFKEASTAIERAEADSQFAEQYDWFINKDVSIHYNRHAQTWVASAMECYSDPTVEKNLTS